MAQEVFFGRATGRAAFMEGGGAAAASGQPQQGQVSCEAAAGSDGATAAGPAVASGSAAVAAESASLMAAEPVEAAALAEVVAVEAAAAGQATEERSAEIARRAVEVATPGTYLGPFEWLVFAALYRLRVHVLIGPERKDMCTWVGRSVGEIQGLPLHEKRLNGSSLLRNAAGGAHRRTRQAHDESLGGWRADGRWRRRRCRRCRARGADAEPTPAASDTSVPGSRSQLAANGNRRQLRC